MKIINFLLLWVFAVSVSAQLVNIEKHYPIEARGFHPVFISDGNKLLITSENYCGLSLLNLDTKELEIISEEEGAGYNPTIDNRKHTIYYEVHQRKAGKQFKSLAAFNLETEKKEIITDKVKSRKEIKNSRKRHILFSQSDEVEIYTEKLKIFIERNGERKLLEPIGNVPGYIWVSLSPDKEKILFTAVSRGTYVCDLEGNILTWLGNLNAPVWYGDDYVVGMTDKDDGEKIISSEIVLVSSKDGNQKQRLTSSDRIALYPAVAAKAKKIAYSSHKGELFIIELDK